MNLFDDSYRRAVAWGEDSSTQLPELTTEPVQPRSAVPIRKRQVSLSRKCEIRLLGRTIVIRR
jgi:hypothetical protein